MSTTRRSATSRTIDGIAKLISDRVLSPGSRLAPEADFAAEMGVSRGSLREAVRVLAYLGILDVRVGDGTYVTDLDGAQLLSGLDLISQVANAETTLEIFEIRRVLESAATSMAASRITPDQLTELRACLQDLQNATDLDEFVRSDIRFHDIIAEATGNASLHMLCRGLSTRTQRSRLVRGQTGDDTLSRSVAEHEAIFRHIEAGESALAAAAAATHVANVEYWLRSNPD